MTVYLNVSKRRKGFPTQKIFITNELIKKMKWQYTKELNIQYLIRGKSVTIRLQTEATGKKVSLRRNDFYRDRYISISKILKLNPAKNEQCSYIISNSDPDKPSLDITLQPFFVQGVKNGYSGQLPETMQ